MAIVACRRPVSPPEPTYVQAVLDRREPGMNAPPGSDWDITSNIGAGQRGSSVRPLKVSVTSAIDRCKCIMTRLETPPQAAGMGCQAAVNRSETKVARIEAHW